MTGEEDFGWTITEDRPNDLPMTVFYPYNTEEPIMIDGQTKNQWEEFQENLLQEATNRIKNLLKGEGIEDESLIQDFIDYSRDPEKGAELPEDIKKTMDFILENVAVDEKYNDVIQALNDTDEEIQTFDVWENMGPEEIQEVYDLPPPPMEAEADNT